MINKEIIIIPGAPKSGSTTLFKMLTKHSKISNSKIKEPKFFLLPEKLIKENTNWYLDHFVDKNKILLDASTNYFYTKNTASLIKRYVKKPRIIFIIRDPAKRTHSHYLNMLKRTPKGETRGFDRILSEVKGPEPEKIWRTEDQSTRKAVKNNEVSYDFLDYSKNYEKYYKKYKGVEPLIFKFGKETFEKTRPGVVNYFKGSMYSSYINDYKKVFKNIKIVFFEELLTSPEKVMKELFKFLGLRPEKQALTLQKSNITLIPNKWAKKILGLSKKYMPASLIKKLKNNKLVKKLFYKPKPKLSKEQYDQARKILTKEYEYWFKKKPGLKELWKY